VIDPVSTFPVMGGCGMPTYSYGTGGIDRRVSWAMGAVLDGGVCSAAIGGVVKLSVGGGAVW